MACSAHDQECTNPSASHIHFPVPTGSSHRVFRRYLPRKGNEPSFVSSFGISLRRVRDIYILYQVLAADQEKCALSTTEKRFFKLGGVPKMSSPSKVTWDWNGFYLNC